MVRKTRSPEENERRAKIRELLQAANVSSMDDIQALFKDTIAEFMESGLETELEDQLGYSRYDYKICPYFAPCKGFTQNLGETRPD